MRKSKTLAKLRAGKVARTCSLGHYVPAFVKMAAHNQYDCLWLDTEHRDFSLRDVQAITAYAHLADIDVLVRVPTREKIRLYRYLEDGVTGLMIPHVTTVAEAEDLVQSVRFPPIGNRGIDGAGLDADYTLAGDGYVQHANAETFLAVQIESPEALRNAKAIAAVEGVDILVLGPADYSLRAAVQSDAPPLEKAMDLVNEAAAAAGKHWGLPTGDPAHVAQLIERGARFISHGSDFAGMRASLDAARTTFDGLDA